jgi:hypothetical protein
MRNVDGEIVYTRGEKLAVILYVLVIFILSLILANIPPMDKHGPLCPGENGKLVRSGARLPNALNNCSILGNWGDFAAFAFYSHTKSPFPRFFEKRKRWQISFYARLPLD